MAMPNTAWWQKYLQSPLAGYKSNSANQIVDSTSKQHHHALLTKQPIKIGYYGQLPAFPSLFFNFLCGYFTDMSHVALRTDHDILRIFLELKNASEFILMYTTRFVLCQVHSYMTDMQMYTTANAEMTFTPPRYWNIPNYR